MIVIFLLIFNPLFTTIRMMKNKDRINYNTDYIIKLSVSDSVKTLEIKQLKEDVQALKKGLK